MSIPKIIHQSWKTEYLPENFRRWSNAIKDMHPTWEWKMWTDKDNRDFIKDNYNWFLPVYDGYDVHIKRVDAVRYFYLYHFGGVYIDMDFMTLKPLELLLSDNKPIFGYHCRDWNDRGSVANAIMISPPKHPLFGKLIEGLKETKNRFVLEATGPNYLTEMLRKYADLDNLNGRIRIGSCDHEVKKVIFRKEVDEIFCAPHNLQSTSWNDAFSVSKNGDEIEKARVTGFMKAKAFASHADEWLNQTLDDSSRGNISPD